MDSIDSGWLGLALAAGTACAALCTWLWTRAFERLAAAWGLVDPPSGRKDHERPTLLVGGLSLGMAFLAGETAWGIRAGEGGGWVWILAGGLAAVGTGLADDLLKLRGGGLSALAKILGQTSAAVLAVIGGTELRLFGEPLGNAAATLLWIVVVTNAWNFLDNMDGLACGTGAIAGLSFAAVFFLLEQPVSAFLAAGLAGFCLGFLPHNFPRPRCFLGDGGTGLLGFLFAVLAVQGTYVRTGGPGLLAVFVPLTVLAVPLFDMVQVVFARLVAGQPVYLGDHRHLSHRLAERLGDRGRAVAAVWVLSAILGVLSVFVPLVTQERAGLLLGAQGLVFGGFLLFGRRPR